MANIIHIENKHKNIFKNKKVIFITLIVFLIFGAGGYVAYTYYQQAGRGTATTAGQDKLAALRKAYDESKKSALSDPGNASKQAAVSDTKSALVNEYLAKKDYTSAQATLSEGSTNLQSMQSEAIIAEKRGDFPAAITALKRQIEYYKTLPKTDTSYDYEIKSVERKITQLQGKL